METKQEIPEGNEKEQKKIQIIYLPIEGLKKYDKNPRKNQKAIPIVKKSIETFGFKNPIIIDKDNVIIAGHTRLEASKELGYTEVPVIYADDLTAEQVNAFRIMDNKSQEYAGWDFELLKEEFNNLKDLDFDLDLTGFNEIEINKINPDELVEKPLPDPVEPKYEVKIGEIYQLGNHRLMCGDSTNEQMVTQLMNNQKADMVFTDPPYSVNYEKKTQEIFKDKSYNKIMNDEMGVKEISEQIWRPCFANMYNNSKDDCSFYMTMPQGGDQMMMMMMMSEKWQVKHELIWVKPSPVFSMGRLDYDYKHEPIIYGWKNKHNFYGQGKFTKSVWEFGRDTDKLHPTMKPVDLIINALLNSSVKENVVIDYFGGSGSTLIACEQTNRKCYMMELDPKYCSVIIERWENLTSQKAIKLNTSNS